MSPKQSKCKSCGAAVYWAVTSAGKRMPVELDKVQNGNIELSANSNGGDIKARVVSPGPDLRVSHFVTCPDASRHRK